MTKWRTTNADYSITQLLTYVHVRVNQWPMSSPCLPIGQFVNRQKTKPSQFSSFYLRRCVHALRVEFCVWFQCRRPWNRVKSGVDRRNGYHRSRHKRGTNHRVQRLEEGTPVPRPTSTHWRRTANQRHTQWRGRTNAHQRYRRRRHLPSQIRSVRVAN